MAGRPPPNLSQRRPRPRRVRSPIARRLHFSAVGSVASPENAAWLSLTAYVRHVFTDYDELLREGYEPDSARFFVVDAMQAVLDGWGVKRRVTKED